MRAVHPVAVRSAFLFFATGLFLLVCVAPPAEAAPPAGYYATVDTSNPFVLATTLHDVIDDHTRFPYTSSATDTETSSSGRKKTRETPGPSSMSIATRVT